MIDPHLYTWPPLTNFSAFLGLRKRSSKVLSTPTSHRAGLGCWFVNSQRNSGEGAKSYCPTSAETSLLITSHLFLLFLYTPSHSHRVVPSLLHIPISRSALFPRTLTVGASLLWGTSPFLSFPRYISQSSSPFFSPFLSLLMKKCPVSLSMPSWPTRSSSLQAPGSSHSLDHLLPQMLNLLSLHPLNQQILQFSFISSRPLPWPSHPVLVSLYHYFPLTKSLLHSFSIFLSLCSSS